MKSPAITRGFCFGEEQIAQGLMIVPTLRVTSVR
jgi:hypothetical protein